MIGRAYRAVESEVTNFASMLTKVISNTIRIVPDCIAYYFFTYYFKFILSPSRPNNNKYGGDDEENAEGNLPSEGFVED